MNRRTLRDSFLVAVAGLLAAVALPVSAQGLAPDCAAIRDANPAATDGDYIISPGGKTFHVYCHDMAGNPREYLALVNTGGAANYSTFGGEVGPPVATVTTHYTRIRIDPATLLVNVGDQTFSSSVGSDCCIGPVTIVSMPYAHASACLRRFFPAGSANIDLTGTPFTVDDVFTVRGFNPSGSANGPVGNGNFVAFAVQSQTVDLTGGGFCGGIGPSIDGGTFNAFGGFDLQLAYTGGVSLDKDSCKNGGWQAFGVFKNQGHCVSWFATGGKSPPGR